MKQVADNERYRRDGQTARGWRGPLAGLGAMAATLGLLATMSGMPAMAHHSTAGIYNEDEVVELTGTVREWRFINPHPSLIIEVEGDDGTIEEWDVSYGGPAVTHLKRQGYTAETFRPGDAIRVRGYAAKVGDAFGLLIMGDPVKPDGSPILSAQP